jgi:ribonuclease HI
LGSGRDIVQKCTILAQSLRDKGVETTIRWIPGHSKILRNEIIDELAKKRANFNFIANSENLTSLYHIKSKLNQSIKEK